ncbi:MAG: hypothetical protein U0670_24940 [Anaerolineae bacterium]
MKQLRFLLVLVALLCLALPAFAQEEFGLSAADSALLNTAVSNSTTASAFSYEFTASLNVAGLGAGSDMSADLTGSGGIDSETGVFTMVVNGSIVSSGETIPAALEVRAIDNVLYVNIGGQWMSLTQEDLTSLSSMASSQLPVDPAALSSGDVSGMAGMGDLMSSLSSLDPATFVSMSRLEDADGNAHFQTAISLSTLFSTPAFGQILTMAMSMNSTTDTGAAAQPTMSPEQTQMMAQMMGAMFTDAVVTFDQWVSTETQQVTAGELNVQVPLAGITGQADAAIGLNFHVDLSAYGEAVTTEAPADAVPFSQAMGGMMGMMGSGS